jgi:prolipoprotein diacylglyceryltransferase
VRLSGGLLFFYTRQAFASLHTLGALLYIRRRCATPLFDGDMLLIYLMFYGLVRSYLETYRVDNWVIAGIPTATWLGVGAFLVSGGFLWLRHSRGWGTPAARARAPSQTIDAADDAGSAGKPADAEAG